MFYKRKFYVPSVIKNKVTITNFLSGMDGDVDDKLKQPKTPNVCYNFNPFDGALRSAEGASVFRFGENQYSLPNNVMVKKAYYYKRFDTTLGVRDDKIVCYCTDNYLYACPINSGTGIFNKIADSYYKNPPIAVNYNYYGNDVMLFSINDGCISVLDNLVLTRYGDTPTILNMCIHNERLFATVEGDINTVWFSGLFNPVEWNVSLDGAGYVTIPDERGKMLNLVSFYDYVYLFREYGISRISAYGDQTDFRVDNLYLRHGKIFGNSITVCGDYIVFLASDGLHIFDGINSKKLLPSYDSFFVGIDNQNAQGVYFDNKLFFNADMRVNGKVGNVTIVYDFKRKAEYVLKGLNLAELVSANGDDYFLFGVTKGCNLVKIDNSGCFLDDATEKIWKNSASDFGISVKNKRLYKFSVDTDYEIKVIINCDGENYYYVLDKYDNELNLDIVGNLFQITIISEFKYARIISPTLYFSYVKEGL